MAPFRVLPSYSTSSPAKSVVVYHQRSTYQYPMGYGIQRSHYTTMFAVPSIETQIHCYFTCLNYKYKFIRPVTHFLSRFTLFSYACRIYNRLWTHNLSSPAKKKREDGCSTGALPWKVRVKFRPTWSSCCLFLYLDLCSHLAGHIQLCSCISRSSIWLVTRKAA